MRISSLRVFNYLRDEIYWMQVLRALCVVTPLLIAYIVFGQLQLLKVELVAMSLFIVASRINLNITAIILHYCVIVFGITVLYFAISIPPLFVLLTAIMALVSIYITKYGAKLRSLGNFTFIPAVYLACELRENIPSAAIFHVYNTFVILTPLALLSVLALIYISKLLTKVETVATHQSTSFLHDIIRNIERGAETTNWFQSGIAVFVSVSVAASLVMLFNISNGQWVIWSSVSVITTDITTSKNKLRDRLLGAVSGVVLGLAIGQLLPKTAMVYSLATIGVMITLIAFKRYFIGFASRCFFIALATFAISFSTEIALIRIMNVFLGGFIGIAAAYLAQRIIK